MDVLEAIADPTRRRIVELVADRPMAAGDIAARFTISRPAVSQHLRVLTELGVLTVTSQGTRRIYTLDPTSLDTVTDWLEAQRNRWSRSLDALETMLAKENP